MDDALTLHRSNTEMSKKVVSNRTWKAKAHATYNECVVVDLVDPSVEPHDVIQAAVAPTAKVPEECDRGVSTWCTISEPLSQLFVATVGVARK